MEKFEQNTSEKNGVWKKVQKYTEAAALVTLLSLVGTESATAQEADATQNHLSIEQSANSVDRIARTLKEKGQSGTMGETQVRRWSAPDNSTVVVGYTPSGVVEFIIQESKDGSMRFYDSGGDGSLDRVVINKGNAGSHEKSDFNDLKTFSGIESLAREAQVSANLEPENVKVYETLMVGSDPVIRVVDFQTGEAYEMTGQDAASLNSTIQGKYSSIVSGIDKQLGGK